MMKGVRPIESITHNEARPNPYPPINTCLKKKSIQVSKIG